MKGLRVMWEADSEFCARFCAEFCVEPKMEEGELGSEVWKWVLGAAEGAWKENALWWVGGVLEEIGD